MCRFVSVASRHELSQASSEHAEERCARVAQIFEAPPGALEYFLPGNRADRDVLRHIAYRGDGAT